MDMLGKGGAVHWVGGVIWDGAGVCCFWGVGDGKFDGVGLGMFLFWVPDCWGVGWPRFVSGRLLDGMFDGSGTFCRRGGLESLEEELLLSGVGSVGSRAGLL